MNNLKIQVFVRITLSFVITVGFLIGCSNNRNSSELKLNKKGYFETQGLNVMVFNNSYNNLFDDSKMSGVEIIHHEVRTVTNGDVRLNPTPEQWDSIPVFVDRKTDRENNSVEAFLKYPSFNFNYSVRVTAFDSGVLVNVLLEKPLPKKLEGIAGFNIEFLPSAYFKKGYLMDEKSGVFPVYPSGPMETDSEGKAIPSPIARGTRLIVAPEDPDRRISIQSHSGELFLFDGRNKAQNGWFVLRNLIPAGKSGKVIDWFIKASTVKNWIRPPVVQYSQVGYHPKQKKVAVIELDKTDSPTTAYLLKVEEDGQLTRKLTGKPAKWGDYLRYKYYTFDFSGIDEPGLYQIEYDRQLSKPFRIADDVYQDAWHPTMDVYFPVQMDHMFVNECYRVWHGRAHLDDALQAPVNHEHFDLYAQGPSTDSPYKPGEHIPGLNVGGWFDAGDFDIRTQTQYHVVSNLVQVWEGFKPERDETTINQQDKYVDIHVPDGKPDILQQIEHGTIALLAQYKAVGHAINGIIAPSLSQYTHLGDGSTQTDNLIYNKKLDSLQSDCHTSGTFDDRWAFTNKSTALEYGSIAALAAASRAMKGYNNKLAEECLSTAERVWTEEHSHKPDTFRFGNTTGGYLKAEELGAAVELLITTKKDKYAQVISESLPAIEKYFGFLAIIAARAKPLMDEEYGQKLKAMVISYQDTLSRYMHENPYGVPVTTRGWAGNGSVVGYALTNYYLHKVFPDIISPEYVYKGLHYLYGCHPGSNISFVSGVGTHSKMVAYGNNRADFSFIAGGVVPGVLILPPDFPENKEDWPFLWGENEYVVGLAASYVLLVNAANELLHETD